MIMKGKRTPLNHLHNLLLFLPASTPLRFSHRKRENRIAPCWSLMASSSNDTTGISTTASVTASISSPVFSSLVSSSLYLGLGLGFSLFVLSRSPRLKPLSSAIKIVDSAIKVPKAIKTLNPTSPSSLYSASKALFKGCKATTEILPPSVKQLKSKVSFGPLNSKQVKALVSTASLVRYVVSPISSDGLLLLNLLKCG
jgi:hypothetical protein